MITSLNINNTLDINNNNKTYNVVIIHLPLYIKDITTPYKETFVKKKSLDVLRKLISQSVKLLKENGFLFIYGSPLQLIKANEILSDKIKFRYWIALNMMDEIEKNTINTHLKHNHIGILMYSKSKKFGEINTKETRIPYIACSACGRNVKDWGGKKHLMNIKGNGISDVWKDFLHVKGTKIDPDNKSIKLNIVDGTQLSFTLDDNIPTPILKRLYALINEPNSEVLLVKVNKSFLHELNGNTNKKITPKNLSNIETLDSENKVILGDCIQEMKKLSRKYPNGIFDLVFADPPYNLNKDYKAYEDDRADKEYIAWCNKWLELCIKLTKPTGSTVIINIPKWALSHASTLNKVAYLQNWIVWDALSTPKGKIMPAHYALLYYTKSSNGFTYNPQQNIDSPEYCLRSSCLRVRNKEKTNNNLGLIEKNNKTIPMSDIWWDIFRIKHKKNRDDHPCQLPDKLMDRIIKTFSNEGNLVFDPFAGAGTTAIRALINNRKYITIEIDPFYKNITEKKLIDIEKNGYFVRQIVRKKVKTIYTKKALEIKVQKLSKELGRKPTLEEFVKTYSLNINEIENLYGDPKKVLKAGRINLETTPISS